VAQTRLISGRGGRIVWNWYWVDGEFTASPQLAKLLQVVARLFGGQEAAAVVAVAADYVERPAEAAELLQEFLDQAPPLAAILDSSVVR
jgi:EpsI family protein